MTKTCTEAGCEAAARSAGYCPKHYARLKRTGATNNLLRTENGSPRRFIDQVIAVEVNECVYWPFATQPNGYGVLNIEGRTWRAHRLVCTLVRGEQGPKIEASHSCGNRLCVNPKHLSWKTRTENQKDRILHGTSNRGPRQWMNVLTECDVRAIRVDLANNRHSQREIAEKFGVGVKTVNDIARRKTWAWLP